MIHIASIHFISFTFKSYNLFYNDNFDNLNRDDIDDLLDVMTTTILLFRSND